MTILWWREGSPYDMVTKVLNSDIVVNKFKLQSGNCIHIRTNTLMKLCFFTPFFFCCFPLAYSCCFPFTFSFLCFLFPPFSFIIHQCLSLNDQGVSFYFHPLTYNALHSPIRSHLAFSSITAHQQALLNNMPSSNTSSKYFLTTESYELLTSTQLWVK